MSSSLDSSANFQIGENDLKRFLYIHTDEANKSVFKII